MSEWFDLLSTEQKKSYIKNHPESKYAHKVNEPSKSKSESTSDVLKRNIMSSKGYRLGHWNHQNDPTLMQKHLEGEGVDTKKAYDKLDAKQQHVVKVSNKTLNRDPDAPSNFYSQHKKKMNIIKKEGLKPNAETSKLKEIASDWWNSLSTENQQAYVRAHPNSVYADKIQKDKLADIDTKLHPKKIREHLDIEPDKKKALQAIGDTFNDAELRIQKHRHGNSSKESDAKQNGQLILNEIAEAEKRFDKAYKAGDTDKSIEIRKAINILKEGYKRLTGVEYFRHHELK